MLNGEDLLCYLNKIESVSLRKCPYDHRLFSIVYLSTVAVTNVSQSFYLHGGGKNHLAQIHTHTHPFNGPFPGLPRWASTRKVKPIWILLKQETVSDSGISWAICQSAPCSRQITTPAPHHSVFTDRMPFLLPNQQRQSTESTIVTVTSHRYWTKLRHCHTVYKLVLVSVFCNLSVTRTSSTTCTTW